MSQLPCGLTDALEGGVGPAGLGAVPEDALDEAGGPSFPFVPGVAGVAQAGVQLRAIPGVDVSVGHGLGGAAVHWDGNKTAGITTGRSDNLWLCWGVPQSSSLQVPEAGLDGAWSSSLG